MRFGPGVKRPGKKFLRLEWAKKRPKLFTAEEVRRTVAAACQRTFPLRPDSGEALCGLSAVRAVFSN
jgi:hypothetical protein